ncbi:MAG TPA: FAD-binding oxidoreductase [Steroidobacter sp.]|uniref:FAD-binding oxidoreductase n=1 Tax=Steroidobacter sp. TaxID=1978227 RepID=UPI002ED9172F
MNHTELVAALRAAVGAELVLDDEAVRAHFSHDLFWYGKPPACVVAPTSAEQVQAAVRIATSAGHPVTPRGGGMSYTGGYVADDEEAVLLDLRAMNRILQIDEVNRYVTVEAGCTWAKLHEALAAKGLRTPYWGPLSGQRASVGGTVSQNSVFFGSVTHGSAAESVLSVEVVLADGSRLVTGTAARSSGIPFVRWGGPDLTGLFIGDAGAFGVKIAVSLKLIEQAAAVGYASFAFPDFASMIAAQADLARCGLGAEAFGIDAYKARNSAQTGKKLGEAAKIALGVIKSGKSLLAGVKDVAGMALAGTSDLENAPYSLHVTVEGADDANVDGQIRKIAAIAKRNSGSPLPPVVPKGMRGRPFPPLRSALGGDGQRWVPVHGILPLGSAAAAVSEVEAMIKSRQSELDRFGVLYSPLTTNVPNGVLYEPCFYWFDEVTELHIEATELEAAPKEWMERKNRPDIREFVHDLWLTTARILTRHGAVNFQIGRAYPYLDTVAQPYAALVRALKQQLDPVGLINPGALGLVRTSA